MSNKIFAYTLSQVTPNEALPLAHTSYDDVAQVATWIWVGEEISAQVPRTIDKGKKRTGQAFAFKEVSLSGTSYGGGCWQYCHTVSTSGNSSDSQCDDC
jgi:hypothetical protein